MRCPPLENGYELSDVQRELRQFEIDGRAYSAELAVMTRTTFAGATPDIAKIMVAPGNDPYLGVGQDANKKFLATCELSASVTGGQYLDVSAMRTVFGSLR